MQYYIKIFNRQMGQLVGYYKETGRNCISKLKNGIKYYNNWEEAMEQANELDGGSVRDADKHYYTAVTVVYGDSTRQPYKTDNKNKSRSEEEIKDELTAIIRKNSYRARE